MNTPNAVDFESGFHMFVAGKIVQADQSLEVINPASGKGFALAPRASADNLDQAVAAAKAAFPAWRGVPIAARRALLIEAADRIEANAQSLARLFVKEQGRPFEGSLGEIQQAAMWMRETASLDLPVEVTEDTAERRIEVHHEPLGVVCGIVPWNFPVLLACWKIAPALLAGNTLVLKPSPFTPLCTLKIAELIGPLFPAGVFNVICGGDELGPLMTAHPGFAKITFTGSTATGKRVMEAASKDLKRITLELGGNDAAIVLPDVDVEEIATSLFFGAFFNTAQVCVATKRLYVHDQIFDAVLDRLTTLAQTMPVGPGSDQGSVLGPVQDAPQYRRVLDLIEDARASGQKIIQGAIPAGGEGYFIPVTLVSEPPDDSRVVTEEAFGPVLPILRFTDVDDVVARANATPYGLAGAVWSADVDLALQIAHRLETGTVWINQNLQSTPFTPLSGHKQSGFGVENGLPGLLEFTQSKSIFIPKPTPGSRSGDTKPV